MNYFKTYIIFNNNLSTSIDQMEKYDSDMIEKSMKEELKTFLNKYKHGIKYEEFMDLYSVS